MARTRSTAGPAAVRAAVLVNVASGAEQAGPGPDLARIRSALAREGVRVEMIPVRGAQLAELARAAAADHVDAVVAAGGDGTVNAVAAALVGREVPLGVVPVGTLNHFARDLGLTPDLGAAARAIARGAVRRVDVGEVNGHVFLNNSSLGLYPQLVAGRRESGLELGVGRAGATLRACMRAAQRFPRLHVKVALPHELVERETPFVFVGNNEYRVSLLALGRRPRLDEGRLCLYFARCHRPAALVRIGMLGLLGRLRQARDFESRSATEAWVETRRRRPVQVSVDGELVLMRPPLHYRSRPGALRVLAPAE